MSSNSPARPLAARADPQLLSLAVHEFRTPATVVGGYLRMLQKDVQPPLDERQKKMVDEAAKSTARIVEIIAEMSDISKLDSGDAAVRREPFDLFTVVRDAGGGSAVVAIAAAQAVQQSYERPRAPLEEKRSGLGLALPLARRVVERQGGEVWSPSGGSDSDSRGAILFSVPLSELIR